MCNVARPASIGSRRTLEESGGSTPDATTLDQDEAGHEAIGYGRQFKLKCEVMLGVLMGGRSSSGPICALRRSSARASS